MPFSFPIESPKILPERIVPCPIVEAIFEIRFSTVIPWSVLPGLLFLKVRDKYPDQNELPLAQVPPALRSHDPRLTHLPLLQFVGQKHLIQVGPQMGKRSRVLGN